MLDQMKIEKRFENDGEKNRLVIELEGSTALINFQVDMIRNNRIPGLLPLEMRRVDSRILLYYDVTGKWMLKDLLDHKEFSGVEFLSLLERFIHAITGAEAYLLDISQFILDEEHIFMEGDMEPRLLYLPVKMSQNPHERFKNLLLQLVVYRARVKDQDSGPALSGILNYMKRDSFNLYEFQKSMRTLNGSGGQPTVQETAKPESLPRRSEPVSLREMIPKDMTEPEAMHPKKLEMPPDHPVNAYASRTRLKTSTIIAITGFQLILAAGVLLCFGPVYDMTGELLTAWAVLGLGTLSLDGLVLKNLLKPENRVTVRIPAEKKAKLPPQPEKDTAEQIPTPQLQTPQVNFQKKIICSVPLIQERANVFDTEILGASAPSVRFNDTEILSTHQAAPYLVRKGPVQEIIKLRHTPMVLGRQADMADHVIDAPAIGRMHAELTWKGDLCQIRDLNSKNGTFVNGIRLTGPQPENVFPGDEIRLGSLEYVLAQD